MRSFLKQIQHLGNEDLVLTYDLNTSRFKDYLRYVNWNNKYIYGFNQSKYDNDKERYIQSSFLSISNKNIGRGIRYAPYTYSEVHFKYET